MSIVGKTEYVGEITWLGHVPGQEDTIRAAPRAQLDLGFDGMAENRHSGLTRASCSRVTMLYPQGTEIRNARQLTVLAQEELDAIAVELGLETLNPEWLGASVVLRGIPDFTHVPPSSRLQAESGATLVVDTENKPCLFPAREIERDAPGHGKAFKAAADGRRGVTAWVERPGTLALGEKVALFAPLQRAWAP